MSKSIDFFLQSFKKQELEINKLIKEKLIAHRQEGHTYFFGFNSIIKDVNQFGKDFLINQKPYSALIKDYENRGSIYSESDQYKVITSIIQPKFNHIKFNENYSFNKFIEELALIEANREIINLFVNNSQIYELMYKLNSFEDFKILNYHVNIENTEIFIRLQSLVYDAKNKVNGDASDEFIKSLKNEPQLSLNENEVANNGHSIPPPAD